MKYSDRLNGYWEEGYHYYIEIRDDEMTVRDYKRRIELKTRISYDADRLESGERTLISVENNVLSRDAKGEPFTMIRELAYENGELKFLYYYTILGETLYTLKKVDHGPFDHILIRDEEYLERLQGEWVQWRPDGKGDVLTITEDRLSWSMGCANGCPFHAVSYTYAPDKVQLVPADLTQSSFPGFCSVEVLPDMLTTYMIVHDMDLPMSVFARADMLDKIEVPAAAKTAPRNTMTMPVLPQMGLMGQFPGGMQGVQNARAVSSGQKKDGPAFCPDCGFDLKDCSRKFCPNCGRTL